MRKRKKCKKKGYEEVSEKRTDLENASTLIDVAHKYVKKVKRKRDIYIVSICANVCEHLIDAKVLVNNLIEMEEDEKLKKEKKTTSKRGGKK